MEACPTNALTNGSLDARRCISYLTIESKKDIPAEYVDKLSGCAFGCDICADVCPWNKKLAKPHIHNELTPTSGILQWNAETWKQLTNEQFNKTFRNSAIQRAGFDKLKKNITSFFRKKDKKTFE
jgi:epoxyqueuosine reductase